MLVCCACCVKCVCVTVSLQYWYALARFLRSLLGYAVSVSWFLCGAPA